MRTDRRPAATLHHPEQATAARPDGVAAGIDVGRRHLRVAVVDSARTVLRSREVVLDADAGDRPLEILREAAALARAELDALGPAAGPVLGAGLAVPAPLTLDGRIGSDTWLPKWADLVPATLVGEALPGVPVTAGNDATLGGLGEYVFGGGRGARNLVYVKAATGIGAGFVINGAMYRGAAGTAGEIGHMTINRSGGQCRCGNQGCLELYAGGEVMLGEARAAGRDWPGLADLAAAATAGDDLAVTLVERAGRAIGEALGAVADVYDPDRVLVGGDLADAGHLFLDPVRGSLRRTGFPGPAAAIDVRLAELRGMSTALGAAAMILRAPQF